MNFHSGFWMGLNRFDESEISNKIAEASDTGISEILALADMDKLRFAAQCSKEKGVKLQSWKMMMINNEREIIENHPDWFTVNRLGESSAESPPYVGYYRWLCPNNPSVKEYLSHQIKELTEIVGLSAIHLDYIRYSDVILPVKCQKKYNINQEKELPQYDYCYCEYCLSKFQKRYGYNITQAEFPEKDENWKRFRLNSITNLVNDFIEIIHSSGKEVTAAVFPTPDIAVKLVRQDWKEWKLDGVYPMLYHDFYEKDTNWILESLKTDQESTDVPVHAGIYLPSFKPAELKTFLEEFSERGFSKICFFDYGNADSEQLKVISTFLKK